MFGTEISRKINWNWITLGVSLAIGSVIFGILEGPKWIYGLSGLGGFAGLINLFLYLNNNERYPRPTASLMILGGHSILLATGLIVSHLFLSPLQPSSLQLPKFGQVYKDPSGLFVLKGPVGWQYQPSPSGVKIKPQGFDQYIGAAELDVQVRPMEKPPASVDEFLKKMTASITSDKRPLKGKKVLHLETSLVKLLDKKNGVWTVLDVYRLWVPLRQSSLFGIKNGKYFCSVSATGLAAHSTLFQVLCFGVYHTLEVTSPR
jgi:hypothetical protein